MLHRYTLQEVIGQGGMGIVYRAWDRLTGQVVALKHVTIPKQQLRFASLPSELSSKGHQLALAQEFQTLASLRHPHIISVLDYGFNLDGLPFFTMNYLEDAQTLLKAAEGLSIEGRVQLLQQVLEALAYLHRRHILHRDLKPGNVLVVNHSVRVLDFGLSMDKKDANDPVGTLTYMAPEILEGDPATESADLYAVGVLAYQLFAGRHPYNVEDRIAFITQVLDEPPDLTPLDCGEELAAVIYTLLAKHPNERYQQARDVIIALSEALNKPIPVESTAVRESYLQAAQFVGREKELTTLQQAMSKAREGQGASWLIGGESGVGKSRLLSELRIRALVSGAIVLHGQASETGGIPYQLWRDVIRRLVITVELNDLAVSVLQPLVPDIGTLLERPIKTVPSLGEEQAKQRLFSTITNLFRQQKQWILLILEDLQWTEESLDVLKQLNRVVSSLPLLIVGSYRQDERPNLPKYLSRMKVMTLSRFSNKEMLNLSTAMLGEVAQQPQVVELLQRETGGNPFFLVEVVRVLAEEAGRLEAIGKVELPATLLPQGIQTIVKRRLTQVPNEARKLLNAAAVFGQQLDKKVLSHVNLHTESSLDLDNWFMMCAEANILTIYEGQWQFSHNKLRDGILALLSESKQITWHHCVATAIENVYPNDLTQAGLLSYHWQKASKPEKERVYAYMASQYATKQYAHQEAIRYLSRALELTPKTNLEEQYKLLWAREKLYDFRGQREEQWHDLERLKTLANQLNNIHYQVQTSLRQTYYAEATGDYETAKQHIQHTLDLTQNEAISPDEITTFTLRTKITLGKILAQQGHYKDAERQLMQALHILNPLPANQDKADAQRLLGNLYWYQGNYKEAQTIWQAALIDYQLLEDFRGKSTTLSNLGLVNIDLGKLIEAQDFYQQALYIQKEIGEKRGEALTLNHLGLVMYELGQLDLARNYSQQALLISHEIDARLEEGDALASLGQIAYQQKELAEAETLLRKSLARSQEMGDRRTEALTLHALGFIAHDLENLEQAKTYHQQSLDIHKELNQQQYVIESEVELAYIALEQNNVEEAQSYLESINTHFDLSPTLEGTEYPFRVYLYYYYTLRMLQSPKASTVLEIAYQQLQTRAQTISDEAVRQAYLENLFIHSEIIDLYETFYTV